jgi:signal transduction histidine kinase
MMVRRTAKVLAMSRAILAAVFLAAVWLDPTEPTRAVWPGYVVLSVYLAWALLWATIASRSWWWDFRLARLVHALDMAVFIIAVCLTETSRTDFSSPFIGFTAFLLITATIRWGQRGVMLTAAALVLSYGVAGGLLDSLGLVGNTYVFARRLTYMITLALMMVWLGADRRVTQVAPLPEPVGIPGKRRTQVLGGALTFTRQIFNARGAAIAVGRPEEPWVDLFCDVDGVFVHQRLGPEACPPDFDADADAALFDVARRRRIVARSDQRLDRVCGAFGYALAAACEVSDGLLARVTSASSHGELLVWGVPDASIDDLQVIASLAREVGLALDREEMAVLAQSIAVSGVRNALARDLHDSVAQFLAGTLFRLEALRRWIREGRDPDAEILAMREALRGEQAQLRTMIDRLRRGIDGSRTTDIVAELEALMAEMGTHWHIATTTTSACRPMEVSIGLAHELRQLVREAVANAVRHGQSSRVDLVLDGATQGLLQIAIGDNGKGFPASGRPMRPPSITERIDALGGQLRIASCEQGVRLDIELPLPIAA